ncbi:MAG TPA: SurA N-terminal domain-containing protein [Acidobacteriota bacterium]|jgi:hypothetical protein
MRSLRAPRALAVNVATISLLAGSLLQGEIVDRVAAVVNNRVITLSDVEWSFINTGKSVPADAAEKKKAFDEALSLLIEQELIAQEVEKEPLFTLREEEVEAELAKITARYGSAEKFQTSLKQSGLTAEQLRVMIRRQLSVLKFIDVRFRPFIIILPDEVSAYYEKTLIPDLKKQGITAPPPLEKVYDQIEKLLIEQKVDQELDKWLASARKRARIVILLFREQSPNMPPEKWIKKKKEFLN